MNKAEIRTQLQADLVQFIARGGSIKTFDPQPAPPPPPYKRLENEREAYYQKFLRECSMEGVGQPSA